MLLRSTLPLASTLHMPIGLSSRMRYDASSVSMISR